MTKNHVVDYANVLSDLKAKLKALEKEKERLIKAIDGIEGLDGICDSMLIFKPTHSSLSNLGAYEATAVLLEMKKGTMKTSEIYQELIAKGAISKETKLATIAATLYKAVSKKKSPKIKQAGRGAWEFNELHDIM